MVPSWICYSLNFSFAPSHTTYVLLAFGFFYLNLCYTYDDYAMLYSVQEWYYFFDMCARAHVTFALVFVWRGLP